MMSYSFIQKSQLEGSHRLDAEYYQPEYLELENKLLTFGNKLKSFSDLLETGNSLTGGATPLGADYPKSGVKFLRVQNIMSGYLDFSDIVYIDKEIHKGELKRSRLIAGDVLLTITGVSYGKSAVYKSNFGEANINQHSVRIHFKSEIVPEYVVTYLNSKYGRFQSDRKITGNTRPALAYEEIRQYKIPLLKKNEQAYIKKICDESMQQDDHAKFLYSQAENMLLEELDLNEHKIKNEIASVVKLSEVEEAGRMDAEYYQAKYEILTAKIKAFKYEKLGNLVSLKKGVEPGSEAYQEEGKLFIRVSSITNLELSDKDQKYLSDELYEKYKKNYEPKVGEILLTKDANPGIAYAIKEKLEGIISSGILRLKVKEDVDIDVEYLALCINSMVGRMQAERDSGGSIIEHWKPEQIKNLLIPILPKSSQKKIADLVLRSHAARKKAKELLEEAKRKVEELIEKHHIKGIKR